MKASEILGMIGDAQYSIQRSKGLGENNPDMMNFTTMNPATRRLIKVMPHDSEQTEVIFDIMLGDNLQGRKEYITLYGERYIELADVQ